MITFIGGILTGILLSIIATISGKKLNIALEKIEKDKFTKEHPTQMAKIVKMQDRIKDILKDE